MRSQLTILSFFIVQPVHSLVSYANDFVHPDYILGKNFNPSTNAAQQTIIQWADESASQGPWSVTFKAVLPPTGDKHTYLSWAPYWWPNCSNVGNTTELSPEEIWTTCPYENRDGSFNPDVRTVNDIGAFQSLSDATLYNSIAWVITGSQKYAQNVVRFVRTWFLDPDTAMLPNLDFAQMQRGSNGHNGTHTGVLDLKGMSKIASAVLILRKGNSPDWTQDLDSRMIDWCNQYITWLTTSQLAIDEEKSANNHGSFYFNQLAALQVLVNDNTGAVETIEKFFAGIYQGQIAANGEQPLEAARTRPYHYRAYNLAAMITNARLGQYAGKTFWNRNTSARSTINTALDYALPIDPVGEQAYAQELYPNVAAVAAIYGDPSDKYAQFLKSKDPQYPAQPYFLWNQPLSDSGIKVSGENRPIRTEKDAALPLLKEQMGWWNVMLVGAVLLVYFG